MRTIQKYLPAPRHTEIHRIFVKATPDVAWEAARHFDMSEVPWIKLLFDIRTLPEKLGKRTSSTKKNRLGVDQITENDNGFIILEEVPGKEVVVGSIGQYWHLKIPFVKITPETYLSFKQPGFGKIAWAIRVEPYRDGSSVTVELRTDATDEKSWKKLNRYYSVIGPGSKLIRSSVVAQLQDELGKLDAPNIDHQTLPGDELIPDSKYQLTYARDIEAPPSIVWQYLMQLGCDRAGWYSIDAIDNGGRKGTDYLDPSWDTRRVGDKLKAAPNDDAGFFNVYRVENERAFVIGGETERMGGPFKMTWAFGLEPIGPDATRLISRARMQSAPKWKEWLMARIAYPPVHGLMTHVQLATIKKYAERDAQLRQAELIEI